MYKIEKKTYTIDLLEYIDNFRDAKIVMGYCKNCPRYNKYWTCPNFDSYDNEKLRFDPEEFLGKFTHVTIFGHKLIVDADIANAAEGKLAQTELLKKINSMYRKKTDAELIELEGINIGSQVLYAGSCILCSACGKSSHKPCIYPDIARYSLESLGFDVGKTTLELFETELKWGNDGQLPEYLYYVSAILLNGKYAKYFVN